jgi:glycerophosphoryl diester phosphodiesterase
MFRKVLATASLAAVFSAGMAVTTPQIAVAAGTKVTATNGCPGLSAHRGALREAPENTQQAYTLAGDIGSDYIEIDGRFNKSGFMYSLHDSTVDRTTNGTGPLANYWFAEANKFSAAAFTDERGVNWATSQYGGFKADGNPVTKIPYSWEILNVAKRSNLKILIDLKETPTKAQMDNWMAYVDRPEFNYRANIVWQIGTPGLINTLKNTYGYDDMPYYYFIYRPSVDNVISGEYLNSIGADGVAFPPMNITKGAVAYWHSYGKKVITWTSDTSLGYDQPSGWKALHDRGIDVITTNEPRWYAAWCSSGMPASLAKPAAK